jgi:hypothetical protein
MLRKFSPRLRILLIYHRRDLKVESVLKRKPFLNGHGYHSYSHKDGVNFRVSSVARSRSNFVWLYINIYIFLIFIVAPCILISPKFFIHQQMHFLLILENSKNYIRTSIKIAPTCFGLELSSGSLQLSLAKVTLMLKQSVKLRRYVSCGGVAACCVLVRCVQKQSTQFTCVMYRC